jgi:glycerate kinase
MKVVIAPDSFKESLAAAEVAAAMAGGVIAADPQATLDLCPLADGGPGTVAAMVAATGGTFQDADVFGPLGAPVRARWGLLGGPAAPSLPGELGLVASTLVAEKIPTPDADPAGAAQPWHPSRGAGPRTAVMEMAAASGLVLVPVDLRDPMKTTTFGTGQLLRAALDARATELIVGIGGSATVDGGAGCAQALGAVFLDRKGEACVCGLAGGGLADIADVDVSDLDDRLKNVRIRVACDVTNPLTGPNGAARVYGPQKGATEEMVERLEAGLANLAEIIRRRLGVDVERLPGAGAAGGLGAGLVAFAGASLEPGLPLIAEAVGLRRRLAGADLVLTGEGKLDRSSSFGKTAVGVAKIAREAGVPVVCIPGQIGEGAPREVFWAVLPLAGGAITVRQAMRDTAALLRQRATEAVRRARGLL